MRRLLALLVAVLVCCATGAPAEAHSGAYDMKYVDGSNVLLLTFNTHAPVSGLDIEHDLRLYDLLGAPIPYDEVSVEVHTRDKEQSTTLRGSTLIREEVAPMLPTNESKLTFAYPVRGAYSLRVVFRAGGRDISRGKFAIDVGQGSADPAGFPWVRLSLTLLLGILVGVLLPRAPARRRDDVGGDDDGGSRPAAAELAAAGAGRPRP